MSTSSRPIDVHYRNVKSLEGKGGKIAFREFRGAHQDGIDGRLMDRINERFFKKVGHETTLTMVPCWWILYVSNPSSINSRGLSSPDVR